MRILVTGDAGFIGSNLCPFLVQSGHEVIGVDRCPNREPPKWETLFCDLADLSQVRKLAGFPDAVVHLAGRGGVRTSIIDPAAYIRANVSTTANLLAVFPKTHMVLASSSSVYGDTMQAMQPHFPDGANEGFDLEPRSPYGASKIAAEALVDSWRRIDRWFSAVILRFFTAYGPWNRPDMAMVRWADRIRAGEPLDLFGAGMERDWTPVRDICAAIEAAVKYEGGHRVLTCNVASGKPVPVVQMARDLARAMRGDDDIEIVNRGRVSGDVTSTHGDASKAKEHLGWVPKVGHEAGIREFVEWYNWYRDGGTLRGDVAGSPGAR
jgi:UDP-glucuronate 4-epimerase